MVKNHVIGSLGLPVCHKIEKKTHQLIKKVLKLVSQLSAACSKAAWVNAKPVATMPAKANTKIVESARIVKTAHVLAKNHQRQQDGRQLAQ